MDNIINNTFEIYKENFADTLIELMDGRNVVQFGKYVGIPDRTIRDWLKQISLPRTEHLIILAQKFDSSIDFLLGLS